MMMDVPQPLWHASSAARCAHVTHPCTRMPISTHHGRHEANALKSEVQAAVCEVDKHLH